MSLIPRFKNISNVSYCLKNLSLNYNAFALIINCSFNYRNKYFRNRAYDLFLYSVLVNMDPVNKLYCFDWMILINAEYVVYSIMCVCVLTSMLIEYIYIYILLYIRYQFSFSPYLLLISRITIIQITKYVLLIVCLFYNTFNFSRIYIFLLSTPFHLISYSS